MSTIFLIALNKAILKLIREKLELKLNLVCKNAKFVLKAISLFTIVEHALKAPNVLSHLKKYWLVEIINVSQLKTIDSKFRFLDKKKTRKTKKKKKDQKEIEENINLSENEQINE